MVHMWHLVIGAYLCARIMATWQDVLGQICECRIIDTRQPVIGFDFVRGKRGESY